MERKRIRDGIALLVTTILMVGVVNAQEGSALPVAWTTIERGLDYATVYPPAQPDVPLMVVRIDPVYFALRVHYRPGQPLDRAGWQRLTPGSVAFINANFFDSHAQVVGLLIADGISYGIPFEGRGGMLQVEGGTVRIRSTIREPYQGEPLDQAVQGFPLMVMNGAATYAVPEVLDEVARRTVVATDQEGRILLLVTAHGGISLSDLSQSLPNTGLGIVNAVNLDGGSSTLMRLAARPEPLMIESSSAVPAILVVYPAPDGTLCLGHDPMC